MAARSKARVAFDSSNTGIVLSNPVRGRICVRVFCVVLSCV
jgi:hypothetical protein